MWQSAFTTLKENPKADLSNCFYCGKFIFSTQLIKLNHFFLFQSGHIKESKTVRRHSLKLPRSVGLSVARCFVRTKSDWPNLTGLDPATIKFYRVIYSRHSHGYFVLLKYCLVRYLRKYSLLELDVIMLASNWVQWMRSIASAQLQFSDFLYVISSKKGPPSPSPPPLHGPSGLCGILNYYAMKILNTIFCYGKGKVEKIL